MLGVEVLKRAASMAIRQIPEERREVTQQLVDNQLAYFEICAKDDSLGVSALTSAWGHNGARSWDDTFNIFGKEWIPRFLGALINEMGRTPLFDLLRFEIAKAPTVSVTFAHIHRGTGEEGSPRFALRFQEVVRKMQPRKGPRVDWGVDMLCDWDGSRRRFMEKELWPIWCQEIFNNLVQDMLSTMTECARGHGVALTSKEEFLKTVERESAALHIDSQTGPANKILVNSAMAVDLTLTDDTYDPHNLRVQRIGRLDDRWDVYIDPYFKEHEALLWHYTSETAHAGMLSLLHYFSLPGHLESTRIRYTKLITNNKFFRLLRIQ